MKLLNLLKKKDAEYIYPTAALCVDSEIPDDVVMRSEHILKQNGYITIKVTNFGKNYDDEDINKMYNTMDSLIIQRADVVYGISVDSNTSESVTKALQYAKDIGKKIDMMHFV